MIMTEHDPVTRNRLMKVAARLFAAQGFKRVTVRDICRDAGANVAAINYHFGDKEGLYTEVVRMAIQIMRETTEIAQTLGAGLPPDERLRVYIRVFLERAVGGQAQDGWIHQIMMREMADPTPAIDLVAEQVVRPRLEYVASIVAEILGRLPDDDVVRRCVLSVQAQIHAVMPNYMAKRLLQNLSDPTVLDELADHIARFSIAGVRAMIGLESEGRPAGPIAQRA
jgi:AcrR family transcriptional regulator